MSLAIDAIILFAAILIIWSGARRGFIRSVMSLVGTVAALFAAYAYTPVVSSYIKEKFLIDGITDDIEETLRSLAFDTNTDTYNLDRLAVDLPKPFTDILDRYGIEIDSFAEKLRGLTGCGENVVRDFSEDIAEPTSGIIASVLSFIVIFIGVLLVLSILTSLLDLIFKLPVLSSANTFLGFLLGSAEAVLFAFVLSLLLSVLVTALGSMDTNLFGKKAVDETIICNWLLSHNPLGGLIKMFSN